MMLAGLLALSISGSPSQPTLAVSGFEMDYFSRSQLRVSFRIFPFTERARTEFPFHPDIIEMISGHQHQAIEKNNFLGLIYNTT